MNTDGKKGHRSKFTEIEDTLMRVFVAQFGTENWQLIASKMGNRTARQCRDRWKHYLCPMTNTTEWTEAEDDLLMCNYRVLGPHWGHLATLFPGRTSVGVRNRCCKLLRQSHMQNCDGQTKIVLPPISSLPFPVVPNEVTEKC